MLSEQYRMCPGIRQFPSEYFYQGKLVDAPVVCSQVEAAHVNNFFSSCDLSQVSFVDLAGSREEKCGKS